jgi:predicted ATP-dependent protease
VSFSPIAAVSLVPEAVDVDVKLVLVGSREQYYELQEEAPEVARYFRAKVDFADSFTASPESRRASSIFVAHTCSQHGLPHFSAEAVARLLEASHREAGDQARSSAIFARTEALVLESAAVCRARGPGLVTARDVDAALRAHTERHDYPELRLREAIADGDVLIDVRGARPGQVNALTQIDLGDYRFGLPVRLSARTYAGEDGLLNIEREVELSGPVHDKGVFILQTYLAALFAHLAPLSLSASIVFEQQYHGVEGDSASCAELYALLSALSGLPLRQGIAVTGAVDQRGEVLPVGGVNEKIEGWFRVCEAAGLDGSQGVLIPGRNRRHLMLSPPLVEAVAAGRFHVYAASDVTDGIALLTGVAAGEANAAGHFPHDSVLGRAQEALLAYRRACRELEPHKTPRRHFRAGERPRRS